MKTFIRASIAAKFIALDFTKKSGVRKAKLIEILSGDMRKYGHIKTRSERTAWEKSIYKHANACVTN